MNKAGRAAAESVEGRSETKGNAELQSTVRTQSRIREAVNRNAKEKLTTLLHHLSIDVLRGGFLSLKKRAAAGVDAMTWDAYAETLEENLQDLYRRVHSGAYRALPSRRVFIPRPIERSFAGASLLALVLTWKYGFHLPLYRQCQIFAHAGMTLSRTTLMQWVAASSQRLGPSVAALAKHVFAAKNLNADDTPIKVLAPGSGKTKRGHLWTYVRDGTAWGSTDPPAVWYQYSPSWHGKYPQKHLASFEGKLQVDAYAGFERLHQIEDRIRGSDQERRFGINR